MDYEISQALSDLAYEMGTTKEFLFECYQQEVNGSLALSFYWGVAFIIFAVVLLRLCKLSYKDYQNLSSDQYNQREAVGTVSILFGIFSFISFIIFMISTAYIVYIVSAPKAYMLNLIINDLKQLLN